MNNKAYLFVFERNLSFDYTYLHNAIKNDRDIKNWWHYLLSAYILITPLSVGEVENKFVNHIPNQNFLLFEITRANFGGWLPKEAWDWIRQNTH